ncbi:MAG: hypothetical protein WD740_07410 [Anaerolineales bacterium]
MKINAELDRLGHPFGANGALYYATGIDGLVGASVDISAARVTSQGHIVTETDVAEFRKQTERKKTQHLRIVERLGIPDKIRSLVHAKSKQEVEHVLANSTLTENDLFLMIHNSRQLGYSCRSKYSTFVPDHLRITDSDLQAIKGGQFEKMPRKIFSVLKERKVVNVHLFESNAHWHCFFFTYRDIDEASENHWRGGPHLHYVSDGWPRLDPDRLWESFDKRRERASSGMHIKFKPFEWPVGDKTASGSTEDKIFPTNRKFFRDSPPIPLALLLTRGVWIATIRTL